MKRTFTFAIIIVVLLVSVSCSSQSTKLDNLSNVDSNLNSSQPHELVQSKETIERQVYLEDTKQQIPDEDFPILYMKYVVNVGMDSDYLVDQISKDTVTYRYFDYQHEDEPYDSETVPFEKTLETEQGFRVLIPQIYLKYETKEEKLQLSPEFIQQLETNPNFRKKLGSKLGRPFDKRSLKTNFLTPEDIY